MPNPTIEERLKAEPMPRVEVWGLNAVEFENAPYLKALCDVRIGHFIINGVRLIESKQNGLFVSFPERVKEKNGAKEYHPVAHPLSKEARAAVQDAVIAEFNKKKEAPEALAA
ncbi:MAG: septation protein SpoVG family protein [Elusimicrobiota bacterium]